MKKAHSVLETVLLLCLVVIIAISVSNIFNNQKMKLTDMSKVTVRD